MKVKCTKNILSPINALSFKMTGGTRSIKEHTQEDEIIALECSNDEVIALGDVVKVKDRDYKVNIIEKEIHKGIIIYRLSVDKRTKASMFILPLFRGNRNLYFWNRLFLNCFISTEKRDKCIALLYRWSSDPLFLDFEQSIKKLKAYKKTYDISSEYILFEFNVIEKYNKIYNQFINGEYSKFTKDYKFKILNFHKLDVNSQIGQILFQDVRRKIKLEDRIGEILESSSELYSKPIKENETFSVKKYI